MSSAAAPAPAPYKPSTRKYCPTCGHKAQDPKIMDLWLDEDGAPIEDQAPPEPCDEPYHDADDEDYRED